MFKCYKRILRVDIILDQEKQIYIKRKRRGKKHLLKRPDVNILHQNRLYPKETFATKNIYSKKHLLLFKNICCSLKTFIAL